MAGKNTITFRNARVRYFDVRRKTESAPFVRISMSADLTAPLCALMGWTAGEGLTDGHLIGSLIGNNMVLTPNDKMLKVHELQFECSEVSDFSFIALKDKEGEINGQEIRFVVRSTEDMVEAKIGAYFRAVGGADAAMKLAYIKAAVQIPLAEDAEGVPVGVGEEE